jgi:L-threonylcarbamoyladenylate synthase
MNIKDSSPSTRLFIDRNNVDSDESKAAIATCVAALRSSRLVAFPTETVYGLGANGLDENHVTRIFQAKGRTLLNPLILHLADIDELDRVAQNVRDDARRLASIFWPGPLTLVLRKKPLVPSITTAGSETVAVRVPSHPVARALLRACPFPLAAPSANRSTHISPTTADHVQRSLGAACDVVLDGGSCDVGIESTVVDVTESEIRILRPGSITASQLEAALGHPIASQTSHPSTPPTTTPRRSPGQDSLHYAPTVPLSVILPERLLEQKPNSKVGGTIGLLAFPATVQVMLAKAPDLVVRSLSESAEEASRTFYAHLHAFEESGVDEILVEALPTGPAWEALRERLGRASHPR